MFRYVKITGDARARGISYGDQTADLIEKAIALYRPGFEARGFEWDQVIRVGDGFADRIKDFSNEMYLELAGIAQGAGRQLGEIVALNARTELLYGAAGNQSVDAKTEKHLSGEGCTGAIALPLATKSGHVIHGQNWDWHESCGDFTIILRIEPDTGPSILTLVEAGTLARCGMNTAGISVTGNFLKGVDDIGRDGIPAPFIRRKILMSENFHDAMGAVIKTNRSFSNNIMMADGGGEAINFETTPQHLFWLRAENDLLVHSNHFVSVGALAQLQDKGLEVTPDSLYRDVRVTRRLAEAHGDITMQDFKDAFSDCFGAPYGVCRSPVSGPGGDKSATLATVIMDVTAGEMHVAARPYLGVEFNRYSLA